jgi:hypothetical protein
MIDPHSVVSFFHKTKWIERALTPEIHHVPGEDTISCSTLRKYVRMFVLSTKETDIPIVPQTHCDFSLNDCMTGVLPEELFHSVGELLRRR